MRLGLALVSLGFLIAATAARAEEPNGAGNPDWFMKPTTGDLYAVWPEAAKRQPANGSYEYKPVEGRGVLDCILTEVGRLRDCKVVSEQPAGMGFGAAALSLTPKFLAYPIHKKGKPAETRATVPVDFHALGERAEYEMDRSDLVKTPTRQDIAAVYPSGPAFRHESGRALLLCEIAKSGALHACQARAMPANEGFEDAALRLADKFQLAKLQPPDPKVLRDIPGVVVDYNRAPGSYRILINFDSTLVSPEGARAPPVVRRPEWVKTPALAEALKLYPAEAKTAGAKSGEALLDCAVAENGALTGCNVERETPAGLGFGQAAMALASKMAMARWTEDGGPIAGARIRLPIGFDLGEGTSRAAKK